MLDTIVIRLHNCEKHEDLFNDLFIESKSSKIRFKRNVNMNEFAMMSFDAWQDVMRYGDSGKEIEISNTSKKHIPSSHYDCIYKVRKDLDYIEFDFSIPKYLYGNNVAQFIPTPLNPYHNLVEHNDWNHHEKTIYKRLKALIHYFFSKEFTEYVIDYGEIEIRRMDICFNQVFDDKKDALNYLNMQKKLKVNVSASESQGFKSYPTGLEVKTTLKYAKIYHKGEDYRRHDRFKHLKRNNQIQAKIEQLQKVYQREYLEYQREIALGNNIPPPSKNETNVRIKKLKRKKIDIEYLEKFADRILRYEMTFRPNFMSYLFKNGITIKKEGKKPKKYLLFRKNSRLHHNQLKKYNYINSKTRGGTELFEDGKMKFGKHDMTFYTEFKKSLQHTHKFFYDWNGRFNDKEAIETAKRWNGFWGYEYTNMPFSEDLMQMMLYHFHEFFTSFQPKDMPSQSAVESMIDKFNQATSDMEDVKKLLTKEEKKLYKATKVRATNIKTFLLLLEKHSYDEIRTMGIYPKSTFYDLVNRTKMLGIDVKQTQGKMSAYQKMITPEKDFSTYNHYVTYSNFHHKAPLYQNCFTQAREF